MTRTCVNFEYFISGALSKFASLRLSPTSLSIVNLTFYDSDILKGLPGGIHEKVGTAQIFTESEGAKISGYVRMNHDPVSNELLLVYNTAEAAAQAISKFPGSRVEVKVSATYDPIVGRAPIAVDPVPSYRRFIIGQLYNVSSESIKVPGAKVLPEPYHQHFDLDGLDAVVVNEKYNSLYKYDEWTQVIVDPEMNDWESAVLEEFGLAKDRLVRTLPKRFRSKRIKQ